MRIVNGGRYGIYADNHSAQTHGKYTRIQNSSITLNLYSGIVCGLSCHVEGSVVSENGGDGISLFSGTVLGNTILYNKQLGVYAYSGAGVGNNSLFANNSGGNAMGGFVVEMQPNACSSASCLP
jgi:hypothetical protein